MFGHDSLPSRIYSYGANPAIKNSDLVEAQMLAAHRYRNALVEVEIKRREMVDGDLRKMSPRLSSIEKGIADAERLLEETRDAIKRDHVTLMMKAANDPSKTKRASAIKKDLKKLYADRKAVRDRLFKSKEWLGRQEEIETWNKAEVKRVRDASGLYWGTYLHVDQSMSGRRAGAPPKFLRWQGDGHIAIQIQKGMTIAEALSGEDQRLRIVPGRVEIDGTLTAKTGIKRKLGNALCLFRVGSAEDRSPVFAEIPFTMHRDMPPDVMIKWVHLVRRRIATKCEWRVQFVLSKASWDADRKDRATDGAVGLDLGWRKRPDGSLRVAFWSASHPADWSFSSEPEKKKFFDRCVQADSDGMTGEIFLPAEWLGGMDQVERIQSHRDENFNGAKASLKEWLKQADKRSWIAKEKINVDQWRSPARLAALVLRWRERRIREDSGIFETLEGWRKRDKHLYEFEGNLRHRLQGWRESIYRNFAAELRRKYRTAKIEKLRLTDFHETPAPEKMPKQRGLKEHVRDAALSILVRCLKESMAEVMELPPQDTTRIHHKCGSPQDFDRAQLLHTCTICGETYDQDENSALNLLGLGAAASAPA